MRGIASLRRMTAGRWGKAKKRAISQAADVPFTLDEHRSDLP